MTIPYRTIKNPLFEKTTVFFIAAILSIIALYACKDDDDKDEKKTIRFAIIADPHLYATELGTTGPDFEAYVQEQIKMLKHSEVIFEEAIRRLMEVDPQPEFLLIPGDLTKDGEEESHLKMAGYLEEVKASGIDVFVVPGNHDVDNPEAAEHGSYGSVRVYSPDADSFAGIYEPFGYGQAISRDPHSLSYVAEPAPGLRLLAIDACRYGENSDEFHIEGGRVKPETMEWLLDNLNDAADAGKSVIAMMHHGLVEHFKGQGDYTYDFIIEDWDEIGYELAHAGMNVIFTGHWHSQNITHRQWDDDTFVVEVQTGTLLGYPVPMRVVDFDLGASKMDVKSIFIEDIPDVSFTCDGPVDCAFADYSYEFTHTHVHTFAVNELNTRFDLTPGQIETLAPMLAEATMAHFAGDERPSIDTFTEALHLAASDDPALSEIGFLLLSVWWDLPPKDNDETIILKPLRR